MSQRAAVRARMWTVLELLLFAIVVFLIIFFVLPRADRFSKLVVLLSVAVMVVVLGVIVLRAISGLAY